MTKQIDTLVADIQELFDGKDLSEKIRHLTDNLGDELVSRFLEYSIDQKPTLRLSNVGKPLRQLWYDLKGYKGEVLPTTAKFKFLFGNILEELLLHLAVEAGHSVTDRQKEVEVDGVLGHIDAVIDGSTVVDVKSCSTRSFEKFKNGTLLEDDPFGYVAQLAGYSTALGGLDGAFLAVDKQFGDICLLRLSSEELKLFDVRRKIGEVRRAQASPEPPQRCYEPRPLSKKDKSGNLVLALGCSYCNHKQECWKDANNGQGLRTFYYSTGPKHFVVVNKQPKVDEME